MNSLEANLLLALAGVFCLFLYVFSKRGGDRHASPDVQPLPARSEDMTLGRATRRRSGER